MDNTNTTQPKTAKLQKYLRNSKGILAPLPSRGLIVGQNLLLADVLRYQWSMLA